ncbi:MAG: HD-GYP domain-containing protein [Lachnospiraceae bacterium]|nr:HD-GYP domain-containing protein [Lachnospiraceae bacterium]
MIELFREHQLNLMLVLACMCGMIVFFVMIASYMTRQRKRSLILLELSGMFLLIFDRYAYIYRGNTGPAGYWMVRISNFFVFFLTLSTVLFFTIYLADLLVHDGGLKKAPVRLKVSYAVIIAGMISLVLSTCRGWYYYFDSANEYQRGPGFLVCYVFPIFALLLVITVVFQYAHLFSMEIRISLELFSVVPLFASCAQIVLYGISLTNISIVMMCMLVYVFALIDMNKQLEKVHRQEVEYLEEQQRNMSKLFEETATFISESIDENKTHYKGHSQRVANYSREIARLSGDSEEECEKAYFAGLLHDVGKLCVPDHVLNKKRELNRDEELLMQEHAAAGSKMLSGIEAYPYLSDVARHHHERYDGTGYPDRLKGEEIPKLARIVAIADAYDIMTSNREYRGALPQIRVREEILKDSGIRFDPGYSKVMLQMIDSDKEYLLKERESTTGKELKTELDCEAYRSDISVGIPVKKSTMQISFKCAPKNKESENVPVPTLILFDSLDDCVHNNEQAIIENNYVEYAEIWFDGHTISTRARNIEMRMFEDVSPHETKEAFKTSKSSYYEVEAGRYKDHIRIRIRGGARELECIVALPDNTRYTYLALTGENCKISNIEVQEVGPAPIEGDIPRIADEIVYTDRIESDLKNIQIDVKRGNSTEGVAVEDGMRMAFHSMSLPTAHLVWHCPYVVLYHSADKKVGGEGYKELVLVRLDGEIEEVNPEIENKMSVVKTDEFDSWDTWKAVNKRGMEYVVTFRKKGNKVTISAENAGIRIKNTTTIDKNDGDVYAALTGDQIALTDIRII